MTTEKRCAPRHNTHLARTADAQAGYTRRMRRIAFLALLAPVLVSGAFLMPSATDAQNFTSVDQLALTANPQYPRPYDTVTITPSSTVTNLSSETIAWTVNGKAAGTTNGAAPFTAQLGGPGAATTIHASANGAGGSFSQSITFKPADVELIAEPDTTAHPLYAGSPLVGSKSTVRLVAIADLRTNAGRIDPAKLIYNWKLDDQQLTAQSGVGASVLTVQAPEMYRDATIYVTVSSADGSVIGQDLYTLSPVQPSVRLYVNDPLQGPLYDNALGNSYAMTDAEESFVAVPYDFSSTPAIAWTIGGQPSSQGPFVTVRTNGNGSGNATIAAQANGSALERAGAESEVSFKGTQSGGIFSLFGL